MDRETYSLGVIRHDVGWVRKPPMELRSSRPGADFIALDTTVVFVKQHDLLVSNEFPLGL